MPFVVSGCGLSFLFLSIGLLTLSVMAGLFCLFSVYFFRDPDRKSAYPQKAVVSPADGRIIKIDRIDGDGNPLGVPAFKISIFMSVFNVHINRCPIEGTIRKISYHPGKFFSANLDKASEKNEKNTITLETPGSGKIVFVQIAGLIARRIVCWVTAGDSVLSGQRFGLIRFGSRLDVYLPLDSKITVHLRQKVKAGITVIGHMP